MMQLVLNGFSPKDAVRHLQMLVDEDYIDCYDEESIEKITGKREIYAVIRAADFISIKTRNFLELYPHALTEEEKEVLAKKMPLLYGDVFTADVDLRDSQYFDILDM